MTVENAGLLPTSPDAAVRFPSQVGAAQSQRQFTHTHPIVLIEKRALNRDCITKALISGYGLNVVSFADVQEWDKVSQTLSASIVLLFVSAWSAESQVALALDALPKTTKLPPFIVFSDDDSIEQIVGALEHGARGYVASSTPLDVVVEALRLVMAGGTFIPASSVMAAQRNGDRAKGLKIPLAGDGFTPRQAAIVEKLRIGKSNKLIAYELSMCESTVKVHVRNIMKKLNAKNRTEVAFLVSRLAR